MAQYINIFVILVNLECTVTHNYYKGCDNIYIYIYKERDRERERERDRERDATSTTFL